MELGEVASSDVQSCKIRGGLLAVQAVDEEADQRIDRSKECNTVSKLSMLQVRVKDAMYSRNWGVGFETYVLSHSENLSRYRRNCITRAIDIVAESVIQA